MLARELKKLMTQWSKIFRPQESERMDTGRSIIETHYFGRADGSMPKPL